LRWRKEFSMSSWANKAALVVLVVATGAWARSRDGGTGPRDRTEDIACLDCHSDKESEGYLEDDEVLNTYVDAEVLGKSVHFDVDCTECHTELQGQGDKHKAIPFANRRAVTLKMSEQCKDCHFQNFTRSLDGVHAALQSKGKKEAAVCVDCHGAHDVMKAADARETTSKTCAKCHEKVADVYAMSVHGAPLDGGVNPDLPTCADCHRAHDIADPKQNAWQLDQPRMCGKCHTDEKMMSKYGLSTNVLASYLQDFHGASIELQQGKDQKPITALCTDCHGVHDIAKGGSPESKVMKENLAQTCRECHPGSSPDFPDAWMSHYEATWERAPLVWLVERFYDVLIPVMIGSLLLQIALHLWRVLVNR
jgi:predicted CXXCH cytochrome family protein